MLNNIRFESQDAFVLRSIGEHLGAENHAILGLNVVVHPLGVDTAGPLQENDVPFHVNLDRETADISAQQTGHIGRPYDRAIRFNEHVS